MQLLRKVYLIRHGVSVANTEGLVCGQLDSPLSEIGLRKIKEIAKNPLFKSLTSLPCYTSHLQRAKQTAFLLGFSNLIVSPELAETNTGAYSALPFSHINETQLSFKHYQTDLGAKYPEGESTGEMIERVWSFFVKMNDEATFDSVVIVAHSGSMNAIAGRLLGLPFDSFPVIRFEHGKINTLVKPLPSSRYWCLEDLNLG